MKQLGICQGIKVRGNINRVLEMIEGGAGDNAISGHFKDEGVNISSQFVRGVRLEIDEFSRKAVSKKSTQKAIKAINGDKSSDAVDGCII